MRDLFQWRERQSRDFALLLVDKMCKLIGKSILILFVLLLFVQTVSQIDSVRYWITNVEKWEGIRLMRP